LASIVQFEIAIARISNGAVGLSHLKVTPARKSQIQRVLSGLHVALGCNFLSGQYTYTRTQLKARWGLLSGCVLAASLPNVLVQQVLKYGAVTLKACRIDVGQVVGDDVHARLLRI
jgi:hypothetical protein